MPQENNNQKSVRNAVHFTRLTKELARLSKFKSETNEVNIHAHLNKAMEHLEAARKLIDVEAAATAEV